MTNKALWRGKNGNTKSLRPSESRELGRYRKKTSERKKKKTQQRILFRIGCSVNQGMAIQ